MGLTAQKGLQALIGRISGLPFPIDGKQQGNTRKQIRHDIRFCAKATIVQTTPAANEQAHSQSKRNKPIKRYAAIR